MAESGSQRRVDVGVVMRTKTRVTSLHLNMLGGTGEETRKLMDEL